MAEVAREDEPRGGVAAPVAAAAAAVAAVAGARCCSTERRPPRPRPPADKRTYTRCPSFLPSRTQPAQASRTSLVGLIERRGVLTFLSLSLSLSLSVSFLLARVWTLG